MRYLWKNIFNLILLILIPINQSFSFQSFGVNSFGVKINYTSSGNANGNSQQSCLNDSTCFCYEPLNANEGTFGSNVIYDPSDSTSKECGTVSLECGGASVSSIPGETGLDMPGTGVSYVLEANQNATCDSHVGEALNATLNPGQTLCLRGYERTNIPDFVDPGRLRTTALRIANGEQSVLQWWWTIPTFFRMTNIMGGADENCPEKVGSQTIYITDTHNSWMRYDHCLDLASDQTLSFRGRAIILDTGKTFETACTQSGSSSGLSFVTVWPGNLFSQSGSTGWKRWKTHNGVWIVDYNPSFWPPKAVEVEGP